MATSPPREQPLWLKILLNICGPVGLGLALLGIINAILGLVFLIGGVFYVGWEVYPSAVALVRRRPLGSLPLFLSIGLVISFCAWLLVSRIGKVQPTAARSILDISALATNITYPDGTKFGGIEWKKSYGELGLDIKNPQEAAIQNIDVTVQVLDKGTIFDMGQLSDVSGVEFHRIDEFPDMSLRLRGVDGTDSTVTLRDMMALSGAKWPSSKWKLFCSRLSGKTSLRLVLATSADEKTGAQPTRIHVFGNYELVPSEGSKVVAVDTVPVRR